MRHSLHSPRLLLGRSWLAGLALLSLRPVFAQVEYVDPTIGNVGSLLVPTRPTARRPNAMIRIHPLRYDYLGDQISGFPLTLISQQLGEIFTRQAATGARDLPPSALALDPRKPD